MTDLADLAEQVAKDLPASVRKVITTALENGWELAKPGMTLALRLNHPTDELAQPVYITWVVGRTAKGALSFRFDSCGTRGLVPLKGADLLVYLADPTVVYPVAEEAEADFDARQKPPKWDDSAPPEINAMRQLGGSVVAVEGERPQRPRREGKPSTTKTPAAPLRIKIPGV